MRILSCFAAAALFLLATPAFAEGEGPDVAKLYKVNCSGCHGKDGKGQTKIGKKLGVPDFTDAGWQAKHDKAKVVTAIKDGVEGTKMKSFSKRLKPEQIDAVADFVKAFKAAAPAAGDEKKAE